MPVLSKGQNFDPKLVNEFINLVRGKSSIAKVCPNTPVPFNGEKHFTFNYDAEVDLVDENGAKSHGGATIAPVTITPVKIEYGMRVSDEFMFATEEEQLDTVKAFLDGFAAKAARGIDLMAIHGINPRTNTVSSLISSKSIDTLATQTVAYAAATVDAKLEETIGKVTDNDYTPNGILLSPTARTDMSKLETTGKNKKYPEFAFGAYPDKLGSSTVDVNSTINKAVKATSSANAAAVDNAIVGDFTMMKWGYSKGIMFDIIEYGNPDNSDSGDLKGHNQVYLRAEAFVGWGIFDPQAFARLLA